MTICDILVLCGMVDVRTRSSTETKQNVAHPWQNGFSSSIRHPEVFLLCAWCGSFGSGAKATDEARASTIKRGFNPITRKKTKKAHRPFPAIEFGTSVGSLREVFEYWIFLYKLEITI